VRDESRQHVVFAPLDSEERLPRELVLDRQTVRDDDDGWFVVDLRNYRLLGKRHLAGFLWAPALLVALAGVIWAGGDPLAASVACGLLVGFFWLVTSPRGRAT
jgi:hypothetical protein